MNSPVFFESLAVLRRFTCWLKISAWFPYCRVDMLLIVVLGSLATTRVNADIVVTNVTESSLPYSLSPQNYELSASNYANSISNYENSSSNYKNSNSNHENSPSNYANSADGKRAIHVNEGGKLVRVGYFVLNDDGVTNFYSSKGKRLFYSPKASVGVYHGEKGFFCGVLAKFDGKIRLALTEKGQKILFMSELDAGE